MTKTIYTCLLLLSLSAGAQEQGLQAESENGKPFIKHIVSGGETLSGISRNYKLTVAEIAGFNKINPDKGLQKGQSVRIPLGTGNLGQTACSNCRKVYYKVQPKEGLYRIGLNFGSISAATLQKLNNLSGESVDIGENLLVGYLPASGGSITDETTKKGVEKETGKPKEDVVKTEKRTDIKVAERVDKGDAPTVSEKPLPVSKPKEEPRTNPVLKEPATQVIAVKQNTSNTPGTGLFASGYEGRAGLVKTGTAAVFKSTSGWDDAKYYVLMSNAEPGTIIKVSNNATGKTVYAKILGELPAIKQNENMLMRISNAAAAALGGGEDSLNVTVNY